jgi:uncharacterized protein
MCCNGTLFNYVTLIDDDLPKLQKYPQLELKERSHQMSFGEPCVLHTGTCCSAYDDRPQTCRLYVCHVLRAVQREELTDDEALLLIKEGKALVENAKEYIAFEPDAPLAVSSWDAPPEGISDEARLAWERTVYHLGKHFLGTVKEDPEVPEPAPPAVARQRNGAQVPERAAKGRVSSLRHSRLRRSAKWEWSRR